MYSKGVQLHIQIYHFFLDSLPIEVIIKYLYLDPIFPRERIGLAQWPLLFFLGQVATFGPNRHDHCARRWGIHLPPCGFRASFVCVWWGKCFQIKGYGMAGKRSPKPSSALSFLFCRQENGISETWFLEKETLCQILHFAGNLSEQAAAQHLLQPSSCRV